MTAARVLEHLPGLRGGIPGPDQLTALVLRNLAADHDQPAPPSDHLTVAAAGGYPVRSYDMLQHDHQRPLSTAQRAPDVASAHRTPPHRRRTRTSSEFRCSPSARPDQTRRRVT